jgi:hypothetical protein
VHRIQEAGIEVWCGMILGFDNDDPSIFEAQRAFLKEARIPTAMIGMLSAIPKTPLHARLAGEGRLDPADEPEFGTNVIPLQMSREELRDGYVQVMRDLYEPDAYFERLEELYLKKRIAYNDGVVKYWRRHPWHWLKSQARNAVTAGVLYWRLMHGVTEARLRREYRRRLRRFLLARPDPNLLIFYLFKCFLHYHQYTMTQQMALGSSKVYNSF